MTEHPALAELIDRVRAAAAAQTPLHIRAGGSKDFYGNTVNGTLLDPRGYRGIVSYEPTELVVTARCGTALAEIEAELDAKGQMLAFEPPHFVEGTATVGGCVAAGLAGPRRATAGCLRDFLLGAQLLNGRGELLRFGGVVMKNVAGYDVARALSGSLGMLGLITEVSLKVLPKPVCERTLRVDCDEAAALRLMNEWAGQPLPISATAYCDRLLYLRLSGARAAVQAATQRLCDVGAQHIDDEGAAALWRGLREQRHVFFTAGPNDPLWRVSVPSAAPPLGLTQDQLIEWGGAQRWLRTRLPAEQIRARAQQVGGHATLFRSFDDGPRSNVFTPLAPALEAIHRRLKAEFDPARIFNPGRMYDWL